MRSGKMYGRKEKMRIWATEEKRKECVEVAEKVLVDRLSRFEDDGKYVFMLKTRELVGIIENALLGINGCVGKPDENGNVDVISADVKVNGHCITLDYSENGQIDRFRINVEML